MFFILFLKKVLLSNQNSPKTTNQNVNLTKFIIAFIYKFLNNNKKQQDQKTMLIYIALFFILSIFIFMLLLGIFLLKFLGLIPMVKNIITRLFSHKYDKKFEETGHQPINVQCYICLERSINQVVATCNHSYCAKCIVDYLESKRDETLKCPACRKEVCVLFRRFEARTQEQKMLKQRISEYNCSNSKEIGFFRAIGQFTNIMKNVGVLFSAQGLKYIIDSPRIKSILMLLIYTLSPVDLMPQMILGPLGLADDTVVTLQLLRQFSNLWIEFVRDEAQRERVSA